MPYGLRFTFRICERIVPHPDSGRNSRFSESDTLARLIARRLRPTEKLNLARHVEREYRLALKIA